MFHFNSCVFLLTLLMNCHKCFSQRRITHPNVTSVTHGYMVYLVKAEESDKLYDNWICGGAIVSPSFIVTSAACVVDVTFMYAISGTRRYYTPGSEKFRSHDCIRRSKKKIVMSCLPKRYNFTYNRLDRWAYIDIAASKVESPFNFVEKMHASCSWIPKILEISYDYKHIQPGTDAMVLGWGSISVWRKKEDFFDYNSECLQYAPVLIQNKTDCKQYYIEHPRVMEMIDEYMICTMGNGNIDDGGHQIVIPDPIADGCENSQPPPRAWLGSSNPDSPSLCPNGLRINHRERRNDGILELNARDSLNSSGTLSSYGFNIPMHDVRRTGDDLGPLINTRRHGFCQNDHGGPLITWVGARPILIGTASLFLVSNGTCLGPYLYTSTQCNGAFLSCVLDGFDPQPVGSAGRRYVPPGFNYDICELPPSQSGFEIVERRIPWPNERGTSGVKNSEQTPPEDLYERPQMPMNRYN